MIFVDTNYFVRFLLHDNNQQYLTAKILFTEAAQRKIQLTTSLVVFFEVVWVLRSSYEKDKQALVDSLYKVLKLDFELEERNAVIESLNIFQEVNLSLEDCYNIVFSRRVGIKEFRTFDIKLGKEFKKIVGKKKS